MVRGPISMALVGILMLAMLALVTGGPRVFEKVLPESAVAWLENMGGDGGMMSIEDSWSGGFLGTSKREASTDPLDYLHDGSDGWRAEGPVAALAGGGAVFIEQVIDGYSTRVKDQAPAQTETLTALAGCQPVAPSAGATVAHVRASADDKVPLGLATYDDADLGVAVQAFAADFRRTGKKSRPKLDRLVFQAYDVAVTETAKPVYLVLEAAGGLVIFNIHLAPGARLERVVMLGGDQMGVAHVAPDVPVEVLRSAEMAGCGMQPFYPLNPNHLFYQSVENGAIQGQELEDRKAQFEALATGWDAAFRAMFGVGAIETVSGNWNQGSISVAGPVPATPEDRPVWQPIEGALVRLTLDQYVEYPGLEADGTDFASTVEAIATTFAWGDLAKMKQGVQF